MPKDDMTLVIPFWRILNDQIPEETLRERLDEMVAGRNSGPTRGIRSLDFITRSSWVELNFKV